MGLELISLVLEVKPEELPEPVVYWNVEIGVAEIHSTHSPGCREIQVVSGSPF